MASQSDIVNAGSQMRVADQADPGYVEAYGMLGGGSASKSLGKLTKIGPDAWQSTGGLKYVGLDNNGLNRVGHVMRHTVPGGTGFSVFSVPRNQVIELLDEAYLSPSRRPVPGDPAAFITPMGRTIGTSGENAVRLILRPGTTEVISAYPVNYP